MAFSQTMVSMRFWTFRIQVPVCLRDALEDIGLGGVMAFSNLFEIVSVEELFNFGR